MNSYYHNFHIPVMGIGHSVDTPIRVASLGISSVISLVDDIFLDQIRKHYCELYGLPFNVIPRSEYDGRAKRVTAYLNTVWEIVNRKMDEVKNQPFFAANDKGKYFDLLPDDSFLKKAYNRLLAMKEGPERENLERDLTSKMTPGSIDVNIMVKLDRMYFDKYGKPLSDELSDAKAALRGYAQSLLKSSIVFSAGLNQNLFIYMTRFKDFYRNEKGEIKKKIIIKVSDFRSAIIQGKYLAKRGLEVHEVRVESGLNCGGHVFPTNGKLLPMILQEFKEKRQQLTTLLQPMVQKYYKKMGWEYPESALEKKPLVTVQGGIGTYGERQRLTKDYEVDLTGIASPFLLVPEATCVDSSTRKVLEEADEKELYMSGASPLNILFNNVRKSGSVVFTRKKADEGNPGSSCPKGYLKANTEFTEEPICVASRKYQKLKLDEIKNDPSLNGEFEQLRDEIVEMSCICHHLGNGSLINLGMADEKDSPQCICPGPNIAWFTKTFTLKEMVDHIYGRGPSLVPPERPHMFVKELEMYVDNFEKVCAKSGLTPKDVKSLLEYKTNLEESMDYCLDIAKKDPYPGENLASIPPGVENQKKRLHEIYLRIEKNAENEEIT